MLDWCNHRQDLFGTTWLGGLEAYVTAALLYYWADRQIDRQTDRPTDTHTHTHTDRQTDRKTDRQTEVHTDRPKTGQADNKTSRRRKLRDIYVLS